MNTIIDGAGRKVIQLDAGALEQHKRDIVLAVREAEPGSVIRMLPGVYPLSYANPFRGKCLRINKDLTIEAAVPGSVEIYGQPEDESSMVFARQANGLNIRIEGIDFNAGRVPDGVHDRICNCICIQAGEPKTKSTAIVRHCRMRYASGGLCLQAHVFDRLGLNDEDDIDLTFEDCVIEDMFDDRTPAGVKENDTHSQGVFHDGGMMHMHNVVIRRVGWIWRSRVYTKSNKDHGLYAVRGIRRVLGCIAEDISHTGFSYRGGLTESVGNRTRRCSFGFQAGHDKTPWNAEVFSQLDSVQDGSHIEKATSEGVVHELTAGFVIDKPRHLSLSQFRAWNASGRGDWAGIHVNAVEGPSEYTGVAGVSDLLIDADSINVEHWARKLAVHHDSRQHPGLQSLIAKYGLS